MWCTSCGTAMNSHHKTSNHDMQKLRGFLSLIMHMGFDKLIISDTLLRPLYAWSLPKHFQMVSFLILMAGVSSHAFLLFWLFLNSSSSCQVLDVLHQVAAFWFQMQRRRPSKIHKPPAAPKPATLEWHQEWHQVSEGRWLAFLSPTVCPVPKPRHRWIEKTKRPPASSPGPSDVNTFLLGLICVLSVAAAIGIIAGAAHFLLGKKKRKKNRSLKAAPEDEQLLERAPMPSTSSMSSAPSMPIQMSVPPTMAMPPNMQMSVPMAQPQPIQYYQPLQYEQYAPQIPQFAPYEPQFAGQA